MKLKLTISIIAFFLLVFSVNAQQNFDQNFVNSFSVLGQQDVSVFQCAPAQHFFSVQNLGKKTATYTVYLAGDAAEWTTVNPSVFNLAPGKFQLVQQNFNVPCDAKKSTDLYVIVMSSNGEEKVLPQFINAFKPENIHVKTLSGISEITSCKKATYNVELYNLVNFEETYTLSLDKFNEDSLISPNKITLKPGESKQVNIELTHKDCQQYGEFPFNLVINTQKTKLRGEVDLLLRVLPEYIVSIDSKNYFNNEFVEQNIPVTLTNLGSKKSTNIKLVVEGPDWVSLNETILSLNAGQSKTVNLKVSPVKESVEEGTYEIILKASVLETGNVFSKKLKIRVHVLTYLEKNALYIAVASIVGLFFLLLIVALVNKYLKSPARKKRKELKKKEKKRKAKEKERLKEELKAKKEQLALEKAWAREYYKTRYLLLDFFVYLLLLVILVSVGWLVYNFRVLLQQYWQYTLGGVVFLIVIILGLLISHLLKKTDKEKIKQLNLELEKFKKREEARKKREREKLQAWKKAERENLKFEVEEEYRNNNIIIPKDKIGVLERERKSYTWLWNLLLFLLSIAFIFGFSYYREVINGYFYEFYTTGLILLLLVAFNLFKSLRESSSKYKLAFVKKKYEFNVGLGTLQSISFSLATAVERLKLKATTATHSAVKPSKWVYDYFELSANTKEENFESFNYNFKVKKTWIFGNNLENIKLVNFSNGKWKTLKTEQVGEDNKYIYYQSTGNNLGLFAITGTQVKEGREKNYWPLLISVGAIILILGIFGFFVLNEGTNFNGIEISKNSYKIIDLTNYFEDPDGDKLTFRATPSNSLTIDISGNKAKLIPDYNFVGQTSVVFHASDGRGGEVSSNEIKVRVTKPLIPVEYKELFKQGIAALVVIIIFLLLIIYRKEVFKFLDKH